MHLSKRLTSIYNLTPNDVAIDVGADHGQLIISLIENNVIKYGYAVENKKGPYERMVKAINASSVKDKITPIFASGINKMPNDVKTIIIAGMGGMTIVNILKEDKEKLSDVNTLLIDTHGAFSFVRKEISNLGFYIDEEDLIEEDGIFYEIMRFKKGKQEYIEDDLFFGPILRRKKGPTYLKKWNKRIEEIRDLLNQNLPIARRNELNQELKTIEENL